jgi:hypothetical protein
MGVHVEHHVDLEEKFVFSPKLKKNLLLIILSGVLLFGLGIVLLLNGQGHAAEGHHEAGAAVHGGEHVFHWTQRLFATLWVNNLFFTGIAVISVFFCAYNYVAYAGWSSAIIRIPQSFGYFLPVAAVMMFGVFIFGHHDLFHWTHEGLTNKFLEDGKTLNPSYDKILAGKAGYLNLPFYFGRMAAYFILWFVLFKAMRNQSLKEDLNGGTEHYNKSIVLGATFLLIFGVTSSTSAWDWVMSIDPHWFSTMFGWYVLASWHVSGLAAITLVVLLLKENGYLKIVNDSHLHDLGKFMFAFSIFWTYVWFAQFLLIFYANIPEETNYFIDRLSRFGGAYYGLFFVNIFINFVFPFIGLMTRESKRLTIFLKIVCIGLLFGHWLDFYLMVMPGTTKGNSGFGALEIGSILIYLGIFGYVVANFLSKALLIPKNHPMLEESIQHDI